MANAAAGSPTPNTSTAPQSAGAGSSANKRRSPLSNLNWRVIGGAVVLLLLVVGSVAGFYLTQVNQDVRQQASVQGPDDPANCASTQMGADGLCGGKGNCVASCACGSTSANCVKAPGESGCYSNSQCAGHNPSDPDSPKCLSGSTASYGTSPSTAQQGVCSTLINPQFECPDGSEQNPDNLTCSSFQIKESYNYNYGTGSVSLTCHRCVNAPNIDSGDACNSERCICPANSVETIISKGQSCKPVDDESDGPTCLEGYGQFPTLEAVQNQATIACNPQTQTYEYYQPTWDGVLSDTYCARCIDTGQDTLTFCCAVPTENGIDYRQFQEDGSGQTQYCTTSLEGEIVQDENGEPVVNCPASSKSCYTPYPDDVVCDQTSSVNQTNDCPVGTFESIERCQEELPVCCEASDGNYINTDYYRCKNTFNGTFTDDFFCRDTDLYCCEYENSSGETQYEVTTLNECVGFERQGTPSSDTVDSCGPQDDDSGNVCCEIEDGSGVDYVELPSADACTNRFGNIAPANRCSDTALCFTSTNNCTTRVKCTNATFDSQLDCINNTPTCCEIQNDTGVTYETTSLQSCSANSRGTRVENALCQQSSIPPQYGDPNPQCDTAYNVYICPGSRGMPTGGCQEILADTIETTTLSSGDLGNLVDYCGAVQVDCIGTSGANLVFNAAVFDSGCSASRRYTCIEGQNMCVIAKEIDGVSTGEYATLAECDDDCSPYTPPPAETPPPGETPPPVGPQCRRITMQNASSGQQLSNPEAGQTVNFTCGFPEDANNGQITRFDFRVIEPNGNVVPVQAVSSGAQRSQNYTVPRVNGTFYAQCRICTAGGCQPFEPIDRSDDVKPTPAPTPPPVNNGQNRVLRSDSASNFTGWTDVTNNVLEANGEITGTAAYVNNSGNLIYYTIQNNRLFRNNGGTTWQDVTSDVDASKGTMTAIAAWRNGNNVTIDVVQNNRIYRYTSQNNFQNPEDVTDVVPLPGSGTITGITANINGRGVLEYDLVRGNRLYRGTSENNFSFEDITNRIDAIGSMDPAGNLFDTAWFTYNGNTRYDLVRRRN